MVYKTENEASLQKLPGNHKFQEKDSRILLLEIEKNERKTLNTFQKLLE